MKIYKQGDTIRDGVKLAYKGTGAPVNLTGCTAFSQMRKYPGGELIAEGEAAIDIPNGKISVTFSPNQTEALEPGVYGFDIRMISKWSVYIDGQYIDTAPEIYQTDIITLKTTRIRIVKPFTELE